MTQTVITLLLVAGAAAFLGLRVYRTARAARRADSGCGAGCGCDATPAAARSSRS